MECLPETSRLHVEVLLEKAGSENIQHLQPKCCCCWDTTLWTKCVTQTPMFLQDGLQGISSSSSVRRPGVRKISLFLVTNKRGMSYAKWVLIQVRLFCFLVLQYQVELLCLLFPFLLNFVTCFFLWVSAETTTTSLWRIPYNSPVALI